LLNGVVATVGISFGWKVTQMMKPSSTKLVAALGGLVLSLTTGVGIASAEPDLGPILNTTCSYPQVAAALNAQSPDIAAQLAADPQAQGMLNTFLASPFFLRQRLAQGVQGAVAPQYVGAIVETANTCNNY
jgi:hemophore-related protein